MKSIIKTLQQKKVSKEFMVPPVPSDYNKVYPAQSTNDSQQYEVNPHLLTCTCGDFLSHRQNFQTGDLRRHCVHINLQLKKLDLIHKMPLLVKTVIEHGTPVDTQLITFNIKEKMDTIPVLISINETCEWAEIMAKFTNYSSKRYSFIIKENRWSLNDKPVFHKKIEDLIRSHLD